MRRLLPILFLVPSVALILYARRDTEAPVAPDTVRVRVETGSFAFPADVQLVVLAGSSVVAPVRDGWAELALDGAGPVTLQLQALGPDGAGAQPVPIGKPRRFALESRGADGTWTLEVTADECRAAQAAIRR